MSRQLVELMGGRLWVESEVGKGSTFHVLIPFGVPREKPEGKKPLIEGGEEKDLELKILVAEDSPTNQLIARKNLEKAGHRVTIANNGLEAVEAAKSEAWDLVLMDVAMPEMDGLEATRTIRRAEEPSGAHVPIIATTAFATKDYQDKCMEAGMDGYVSKPVSVDELYATIEPFLAAKAAETATEPETDLIPAVDLDMALEVVGGDQELLQAVSEMSLGEIPEQFKQLTAGVTNRDAAAVEAAAHRLKGVLSNLGGMLARDVAQTLETMGENGNLDGADRACQELEEEVKRVIAFYMDYEW
jgi:CheY-like chemotaxis protein